MKSSKVLKVFEQYVKKYDMNNANIKSKYFHSLKMMELAKDIATTLGIFNEEEITVCELIGLFHEIGNFNSTPNSKIINDSNENCTEKTFDILFNNGLLRKITDDTKYDDIIKLAILFHDKNDLPSDINEKEKHFCLVIKDAHKLDIFRLMINYPYLDTRIDIYPSDMTYKDFKDYKVINEITSDNNADSILVILSYVYNLNYRYSYYLLNNNNYITKVIESLTFGSKDIESFFKQLDKVLNNYVLKKIVG